MPDPAPPSPSRTRTVALAVSAALAVVLAGALVASYLPKDHAGDDAVVKLGSSPTFAMDQLLGTTPAEPLTGRTLPSASLDVLSGSPAATASLPSLADGHPTVINVWSSNCTPCQRETPALVGLWRNLHQGGVNVRFVGLDVQDTTSAGAAFLRRFGATDAYPMLSDPSGQVAFALGITRLPTTLLVASDGRVVDARYAAVTATELRALLRQHFDVG